MKHKPPFPILTNKKLSQLLQKPALFTPGDAQFWVDPYISQRLLEVHLDPTVDAASRSTEVINRTVAWIMQALRLQQGDRLLDLGCGPGLYAARFAQQGLKVTGVDFSPNSIAYATQQARAAGLEIDYHCQDYLQLDVPGQYEAALLIYGDYCPLSPAARCQLLDNVRRVLKPGGHFVFDVSTPALRRRVAVPNHWYAAEGGFWRPGPHLVLERGIAYENDIFLDQYVVIETGGKTCIYNHWFQDYTPETIRAEIEANGFIVQGLWGDLAGASYNPDCEWIGVMARRE